MSNIDLSQFKMESRLAMERVPTKYTRHTFEVGDRNKTNKQITGVKNAYRLVDDVEVGFGNRIPLWLLGLLEE